MKKLKIFLFAFVFCISNMISFSYMQDLDDLSFGENNALEIATWNIEWFPKNGQITIDYVSQIIKSLDIDVLAIQEVDDTTQFKQMVNDLDGYEGYFQSAWFAGLAYIYKADVIDINHIYEIYTTSQYWSAFPRSPMVMDFNFMGENYIIINNHLKCCGNGNLDLNDQGDEETRRYNAMNYLKDYVDQNFSNHNVIITGDLNDILTDDYENNVFRDILNDSENYLFADLNIAYGSSSDWSYPTWPSHIDHILITNDLFDEFDNSVTETIKIDDYLDNGWYEYDQNISDHRPVAVKFLFDNSLIGDINQDQVVNILDCVQLVNLVLVNQYEVNADLNIDGLLNILDIVILINIILI